jgi:phospholipid/cholesterol/gamma-HCH transport system permease protein
MTKVFKSVPPRESAPSGRHPDEKSGPYHLLLAGLLGGQVVIRLARGRLNYRRAVEQMVAAGPGALLPVLMTNFFAGMIFTLQTARELERFGAMSALGGAFAVAFCRELSPILTAAILAGQVGSAFAAEIGAMKVSDQLDALKMLRTDPVDYLVVPRVVACCAMLPVLMVVSLVVGIGGGSLIAQQIYGLPLVVFLDSVRSQLMLSDLLTVLLKGAVFGTLIALLSCSWGLLTTCSRSVGRSTTAAVVTTWVMLFVVDFILTLAMLGSTVGAE